MAGGKPCRVCNYTRQKSVGLAVPSIDELKIKGGESLGFSPSSSVKVVLEEDGTIVEDQAYFLCLPLNTKFMLLAEKETWSPVKKVDGGTAWMARDSVLMDTDEVDAAVYPWVNLAQRLKEDMASVILMAEADLQMLIDVPHAELASALGYDKKRTEDLQETLQRYLDRKEEERQSKELLQLYFKAMNQGQGPEHQTESGVGNLDVPDGMEVDSASGFLTRTIMVLKGKTSPETRLSTEDLQLVVSRGVEPMEQILGWDRGRTSSLLQACEAELKKRLEQIRAVQFLRSNSQIDSNPTQDRTSTEQDTVAQGDQ
ncbi:DNA fragmentation factor subunit alpha [Boleophthalmus pectinirostris]|uniref:DNA fragmentation factor subunit alpha n=1 Tax=Boleophthalmus pectinirostris TaxID=150288 RepID=UPI0024329EA6|nr:DNA fragmentation factor subunit alpha [Boleophthalmus pectinirostris]